jgi:predicted esterase
MVKALRGEGLPGNVAIVLVEGPYHTWFGHQWGDTEAQQTSSRQRLRERLRELLGDRGPPRERVVIAGFSQGAGVAIDMAVEEPRIGGVASFSPCSSMLRAELPKRGDLRILLAHGATDAVCPVEESRSLARALDEAHRPARYLEFDGPHTIPLEVVGALVTFATAR